MCYTGLAHGDRLYLADAPYVLPSDAREVNRLDFQHYDAAYAQATADFARYQATLPFYIYYGQRPG